MLVSIHSIYSARRKGDIKLEGNISSLCADLDVIFYDESGVWRNEVTTPASSESSTAYDFNNGNTSANTDADGGWAETTFEDNLFKQSGPSLFTIAASEGDGGTGGQTELGALYNPEVIENMHKGYAGNKWGLVFKVRFPDVWPGGDEIDIIQTHWPYRQPTQKANGFGLVVKTGFQMRLFTRKADGTENGILDLSDVTFVPGAIHTVVITYDYDTNTLKYSIDDNIYTMTAIGNFGVGDGVRVWPEGVTTGSQAPCEIFGKAYDEGSFTDDEGLQIYHMSFYNDYLSDANIATIREILSNRHAGHVIDQWDDYIYGLQIHAYRDDGADGGNVDIRDVSIIPWKQTDDVVGTTMSISDYALAHDDYSEFVVGEFGTNSTSDTNDQYWGSANWSRYVKNSTNTNTSHTSMAYGQVLQDFPSEGNFLVERGLRAYFKFNNVPVKLGLVRIAVSNTDVDDDPEFRLYDDNGNTLIPDTINIIDDDTVNNIRTYELSFHNDTSPFAAVNDNITHLPASLETFTGFKLSCDGSTTMSIYEMRMFDWEGQEFFRNLTALTETDGTTFASVDAGEFNVTSTIGAVDTAAFLSDSLPDPYYYNSETGSPQLSPSNGIMTINVKPTEARSIRVLLIAMSKAADTNPHANWTFYDQNDNILYPILEPLTADDVYQTTSDANVNWYKWVFPENPTVKPLEKLLGIKCVSPRTDTITLYEVEIFDQNGNLVTFAADAGGTYASINKGEFTISTAVNPLNLNNGSPDYSDPASTNGSPLASTDSSSGLDVFARLTYPHAVTKVRMVMRTDRIDIHDWTFYDQSDNILYPYSYPRDGTDIGQTTSQSTVNWLEWAFGNQPATTAAPTITGTYETGQELTVSNGTWTVTPDSYTYQWYRDNTAISGATSSAYTLVVDDILSTVHCKVGAVSNSFGTGYAWAIGEEVISGEAGAFVAGIKISLSGVDWIYMKDLGIEVDNTDQDVVDELTAVTTLVDSFDDLSEGQFGTSSTNDTNLTVWDDSAWDSAGTPTDGSIHRNDSSASGIDIYVKFTSITEINKVKLAFSTNVTTWGLPTVTITDTQGNSLGYVSPADVDDYSHQSGTVRAFDYIFAVTPVNTVAPEITGTIADTEVLTCSTGTWVNTPSSYAYQWYRDDVVISGETSSTYTLLTSDDGTTLKCKVTATNDEGTGEAFSNDQAISYGGAAFPTYTGFTLDRGTHNTNWTGIYEIRMTDDAGVEFFNGLTAIGETANDLADISAGQFTTDSNYGATGTSANLNNNLPDITNASSSTGTPEWSSNGTSGIKIFVKPSTATSIKYIDIALTLGSYSPATTQWHFYDQDSNELIPVDSPADDTDVYQTTNNGSAKWFRWTFDANS